MYSNLIHHLSNEEKVQLMLDLHHRGTIHHAIWFQEVIHQYGRTKAYQLLNKAYQKSYQIQLKRILGLFDNHSVWNNSTEALHDLSDEKKLSIMKTLSINWLVNDGVWFQTIEEEKGMLEAKRCNDSAWANFSPFEASAIASFLQLGKNPGLEGLKTALQFRLYAFINTQSITNETETGFEFYMNECRVQVARNRKNLPDYPCKSAGVIEYTSFAETIDPAIKTHCIACPPDNHPQHFFCGWKFYV
jgi:hypothetical protein